MQEEGVLKVNEPGFYSFRTPSSLFLDHINQRLYILSL